MHRRTLLRSIPCDLKQLPIGALEAFVLAQVHGRSTVEEVAEATGLTLDDLLRVAERLVDLGALAVDDPRSKTKRPRATARTERPAAALHSARPASRTLVPPSVIPVARSCPDLRSLGIGPREGFVLSQIDGATSMADLTEITHLSARELSEALEALEGVGAIELPHRKGQAPKAPAARPTKAPQPRATKTPPRPTKAPRARASKAPSGPPPASEKTAAELPEADRARIADMAARTEPLDHYAALGVEREADARTIRRAYHALAAQFHPDRFFGKKLGSSRQPLERIFARLTLAYETLSRRGTREEYDATLPPAPAPAPASAPAPAPASAPPRKPSRKSLRAVRAPSVRAPRRKTTPAPAPQPPPEPSPIRSAVYPSGPDPLVRMLANKKRSAVQEHVDVFVRAAKEALGRDDVVTAANNYGLAVQCSDDPAIRAAFEEADARARNRVRDASLEAARVAEKAGRWGEAGAKYARAHGARAEAWIAERAAHAFHREGTDLRRAAQLAEQAVLADPQNASYRVTLGEIYFDAGLMARAAGEAARALALAPADPRANELSKRVSSRRKG